MLNNQERWNRPSERKREALVRKRREAKRCRGEKRIREKRQRSFNAENASKDSNYTCARMPAIVASLLAAGLPEREQFGELAPPPTPS